MQYYMIMMTLLHYQLTLHRIPFEVLVLQVKTVPKLRWIVAISCRQETTTGALNLMLMRVCQRRLLSNRVRVHPLRDWSSPICPLQKAARRSLRLDLLCHLAMKLRRAPQLSRRNPIPALGAAIQWG
jgi:hypothetical protein